jgi:hypothetical protein
LGDVVIVEAGIAVQGGGEILSGIEASGFEDIGDPSVETLDCLPLVWGR